MTAENEREPPWSATPEDTSDVPHNQAGSLNHHKSDCRMIQAHAKHALGGVPNIATLNCYKNRNTSTVVEMTIVQLWSK